MRWVSVFVVAILLAVAGRGEPSRGQEVFESGDQWGTESPIDQRVLQALQRFGIRQPTLCSESVFLRRAYLDVIGTLPTAEEARAYLASRDPRKRRALIDRLLAREEFADYWAMKWCDLLRVKAEFPINLWPNAAQAYHRWIRASIRDDMPYDQFARELLTSSGSNFRVPQVNFYRAVQIKDPATLAQVVALTFMGSRVEHWSKARHEGMARFFAQIGYKSTAEWKEEIVYFDAERLAPGVHGGGPLVGVLPDQTEVRLDGDRDPRSIFAEWLIRPGNPWFARAFANRVWSWLLGRGIVHEPDDLRPDNPPSNPELLEWLEQEVVAKRFRLRDVLRTILNSSTYQASSLAATEDAELASLFAAYPVRRLDAEVLIDALCQVTGTTEKYTSPIPEPFTFIPEDQRSIALPDGSISSPFLELFGRPARDTGLEGERQGRITAAQRLHFLNSSHVQKKIEQSRKLSRLLAAKVPGAEILDELYLLILSRYPTPNERQILAAYFQEAGKNRREASLDVIWALLNSAEFFCRH